MNLCFGILFGGESFEHEISIVSAITLKNILHKVQYFIFLDSNHKFYLIPAECMHAPFFAQKSYTKCKRLFLCEQGFQLEGFFKKSLRMDCVINLVHGADGEDGKLASLLEFYHIPFIGPRIDACCLSFNKSYTKSLALNKNIPTLPYHILYRKQAQGDPDQIDIPFTYPIILKPARLGSSIGISIAREEKDLEYALDRSFEYDNCIIIEPFISGIKEYNIAGFKAKDGYHLSIIEEPQKTEYLDFDKKYLDFARCTQALEASLDANIKQTIRQYFKKIYENLFEGALIRCDFFLLGEEVYLNEINPIPGSLANYLFKNFNQEMETLAKSLPQKKPPHIDYSYIEKIKRAK